MLERGALRLSGIRKDRRRTRRTSAARYGDKYPVAYGTRLPNGNKGGERLALKEKSRCHTVFRS